MWNWFLALNHCTSLRYTARELLSFFRALNPSFLRDTLREQHLVIASPYGHRAARCWPPSAYPYLRVIFPANLSLQTTSFAHVLFPSIYNAHPSPPLPPTHCYQPPPTASPRPTSQHIHDLPQLHPSPNHHTIIISTMLFLTLLLATFTLTLASPAPLDLKGPTCRPCYDHFVACLAVSFHIFSRMHC
jgi:hypothetical protein